MKKFIVVGVLALVVIGCVLAAGCTSTTSNGNASGYMIPGDQYLGYELELQLENDIDLMLVNELENRMDSNQLTQAEFAEVFGTTTQNKIVEILGKKSFSASGTMTDAEMKEKLEKKLAGTKVLLGDKNLDNISEWSNADLMTAIKVRVANKDQAFYESMKVAGTMPSDIQGIGIIIEVPWGETKGITLMGYGYSDAALKEASQLSGKMTEGTTEAWEWNNEVPFIFGPKGELSVASGAALPSNAIVIYTPWFRGSEGDLSAASSDASEKQADIKKEKKLSAATGAMTDNLDPSNLVLEHKWFRGSEGELSAASGAALPDSFIEELDVPWHGEFEGDLSEASGTAGWWVFTR